MSKKIIPVFFATDDNYVPYMAVSIKSLLENANRKYLYKIYILISTLSEENKKNILSLETSYSEISFVCIKEELDKLSDMLCMRDYYSKATYYRFFIAHLFPQYNKVLYLDCDIVVTGDISRLYSQYLGDCLVGAVQDEVINDIPVFCDYVEQVVGVQSVNYFNAGILLMNTKAFREERIQEKFVKLLNFYKFTVAQDQDYLNVICKERVKYLNLGWNKTAFYNPLFNNRHLGIVHYKMNWKPWHFDNVEYQDEFWKYADMTPYAAKIHGVLESYTDLQRKNDLEAGGKLLALAKSEIDNPENFQRLMSRNDTGLEIESPEEFLQRILGLLNVKHYLKNMAVAFSGFINGNFGGR